MPLLAAGSGTGTSARSVLRGHWLSCCLSPPSSVPVRLSMASAHALFAEYMPFILLLTALFTVSGGIYVSGNLHGSPGLNALFLAIGTVLASVMGTTGASMLLIRPLIRANDNRRHQAHVIVFFIILVSNIGGALTPLGDPPLFLGFLKGVDFFWTMRNIFPETLFLVVALLAIFFAVDSWLYRREGVPPRQNSCRLDRT